jgi:membrane fusion protein (multidrug efflux system)
MQADQAPTVPSVNRLRLVGILVLAMVTAAVIFGIELRGSQSKQLEEWTEAQAVPTVAVALPNAKKVKPVLDLPGRLEAYSRAPIFARISGYLKSWMADIGTEVKAGQLLAEIEVPDIDQELLQARADLVNAQSNADLSQASFNRWRKLGPGVVPQQEIDERAADLAARQAQVKAAQANVDRLQVLAGYSKIVAPFDGLVTARDTDVGALINSGASNGPALFVISDIKRLRVYINVPQNYAPAVKVGNNAVITVPEYPGRTFPATVEASSQAVEAASGTTRMQLVVDNADGALMPGAYAGVRLDLSAPAQPLNIPASALLFDKSGIRVATVGPNDRVRFKPVTVARDLGTEIAIATGLTPADRIIVTPPDGLADGDQVRILTGDGPIVPAVASEHNKRGGQS